LLKSNDRAGAFLEQPPTAIEGGRAKGFNVGEKAGDTIGRYKLLQQLGEGGCGIVFMAQQEEPVHRRVALKVVKPGMDTKSVIARFEAERQALALMDHPNVAHVFDAGATESGRPYFVMELVQGAKITDYCDQHSLPTSIRLELFRQVCDAIQHAHQKGIIHRDIKPSNVLVSQGPDGKPVPKVIDFGIAKAMFGQQLTDKTIFTARELLIGTPAYMSPEQATLASSEIDTRTDIYSLGVLLYELLTGTTPFDAQALLKAGLDEVRRVIRDEEPVRPSTRLSATIDAVSTAASKRHGTETPKLVREMRGELDWIVMKAMEKDPARRYATANGFAMDLGRYLSGDAIVARPPSASYKFRKLFLRNRLLFIGLGAIFVLLSASLAITTRLFIKQQHDLRSVAVMKLEAKANRYIRENNPDGAEAAFRQSLSIRRRYLNSEPPPADVLFGIINGLAAAHKRLEAIDLLGQVLTPAVVARPDYTSPIGWRAELCGQYGRWQVAAEDAMLLVKREPANNTWYHMLAPLLIATTNLTAYENHCTNILAHFGNTTDFLVADKAAKDCLIIPSAAVDAKTVAALATLAVTKGKGHPAYHFFQFGQALAQYRLGNYKEATNWAQESVKNQFPYSQAEAYAVLAMAQYKLGDDNAARQALTNCNRVIASKLPALGQNLGFDWRDWIIVHALRQEAQSLINH
jgi:serine/threonine protein kinase